ncbi:MAG: DNA ligase D [Acetobacteraceae bacterium]|nr:DNA ligase D [Acetobacteraceae bacterium]
MDAARLEAQPPLPEPRKRSRAKNQGQREAASPIPGAVQWPLPEQQAPQLATLVSEEPSGEGWLSEVKFDGYRLLAFKDGDQVRLITRNGHDWTNRLPAIAGAVRRNPPQTALFDGELVALREDGISSFALLQQALSEGVDGHLFYYAFDLLHEAGWDLRPCRLIDRKTRLYSLAPWRGALRYSDHVQDHLADARRQACRMGLEGLICKRIDAPYRPGRSKDWLKLKCAGREEFVVLGWTGPSGSRTGIGSLHVGYRDPDGVWQYAGGVGTGYSEQELAALRRRLDPLASPGPPSGMVFAGDPVDKSIHWVKPELVVEIQFIGWSGAGRLRHATYLGLREDKHPEEVVREPADPEAPRIPYGERRRPAIVRARAPAKPAKGSEPRTMIRQPRPANTIGDFRLTNADRELWPGITKRDLAEYWLAMADVALKELAGRPLALVRCPEGIQGERFFQKHAKPGFPREIRAGEADGAPYLVVEGTAGLLACAQVAAIELHAWGSRLPDALHPDRLVFDLDPGGGVGFPEVIRAAYEVRERLKAVGLESFCRTTGGKGLHIVAPVRRAPDWDTSRAWCRRFAEAMVAESPDRYVSRLAKVERQGKILVDWLRNGLGSTAVSSYSPRARPGATVATPLAWREVAEGLDPAQYTVGTVPQRVARQSGDPWPGFYEIDQAMPQSGGRGRR